MPPPPQLVKKQAKKRWLLNAAAYISSFLPPLSEVSGSTTEMTDIDLIA